MRVLFVQQQPCIRTLKIAVGLKTARPEVRIGFAYRGQTLTEWYGSGDDLFDGWWRLGDEPRGGLRRAIREFHPDIVHSHNLPDSLTVAALDVADGSLPVVHDVHDFQSLRTTPYEDGFPEPDDPPTLERVAVEESAAVVTVSSELLEEVARRHRLPRHALVFPNYVLERDLPAELPPEPPRDGRPFHLVYQGTLSTNGGHYDLRDIFVDLLGQGLRLDVFPARPQPPYADLAKGHDGMRFRDQLPPERLMLELPRYDFGWAGFNERYNRLHLDTVLPNKAFEYLGCGVPIVTLAHRALARFVEREGVGAVVPSLAEVGECLAMIDLEGLRRHVASVRTRFTMEANVGRIVDLYREVIGRP